MKTPTIVIVMAASILLAGCGKKSDSSGNTSSPTINTNSSPRFITKLEKVPSSDGPWTIKPFILTKGLADFVFSYSCYISGTNTHIASILWENIEPGGAGGIKLQPGWFVYFENNTRLWAYDGGTNLAADVVSFNNTDGNVAEMSLYRSRNSYNINGVHSDFPQVPVEVYARLSPAALKTIGITMK